MLNKKFENKENGEIVIVKSDDNIWVTLENGVKIKKDSFFNKYTETIDPALFFNNRSDIEDLANKITKIDTDKITNNDMDQQPIIRKVDESYENIANDIDKKQQMIQDFLEKQKLKDSELSKYKQVSEEGENKPIYNNPNYPEYDPNIKMDRDKTKKIPIVEKNPDEEMYKFFKGFKKNHKITIELKFEEMISDPEFLKLMMNNFEADIIKYYTIEIFKNIANNPKKVEDEIYKQLEEIILNKKSEENE